MHEVVQAVCVSLDNVAKSVLKSWNDERTLLEAFGWNCPAVTKHDLAVMPQRLADRLRKLAPSEVSTSLETRLQGIPAQMKALQSGTIPHLYNGHASTAAPAYVATFVSMEEILQPLLGWQGSDSGMLPPKLARRIRSYNAQLDELAPNKELLANQLEQIRLANEAAETLPVDMEDLVLARKRVEKAAAESELLLQKIIERESDAQAKSKSITDRDSEAAGLVANCEDAYRITTTKGLSAAFQQRAFHLSLSVGVWVALLFAALAIGASLGFRRIEIITESLVGTDPKLGVLWLQFALSALSVGAPLWFAWLATKQIGQRFRLAEDYAFKASVAKAYEGYRKEAARIDPEFEKQLFASALARLEEAPLRLIEQASHGGPWAEMVASKNVDRAMRMFPDLRDRAGAVISEAIARVDAKKRPTRPVLDPSDQT